MVQQKQKTSKKPNTNRVTNNNYSNSRSINKEVVTAKGSKLKSVDNTKKDKLAPKETEVINLSSDDEDKDKQPDNITNNSKPKCKNSERSSNISVAPAEPKNNNPSVVINDTDSESSSHTTTSSSRLSVNYEAEDENESEMKAKQQTQQETQTQQHLMQVQTFLKSFDTIQQSSLEKSSLTELRNFRQTSKPSTLTKPGKFNISTKFLRKSRNKLKSQTLYHTSTQLRQQQHQHQQQVPEPEDISLNNCDESIAKLRKDFSIDSLLNN